MRIIAVGTLRAFWSVHRDAEQPLRAWVHLVRAADWDGPTAVKAVFAAASILPGNRAVFNIGGNKYRLVVRFAYRYRIGYVRFIGTHADYDRIDATMV